ncbi:hypothetical protein [Agrobacterium vaccinii]|uniref:hypothetical protein n=1 Tax=Agrobacterium vaccinii TaxID=2735528 RepID=UPI001E5C71E1|nr:hypothetical protein [Agrobacterium vaccinii]UHS59559.1 hypothetical protein HRS00_22385 [Agrobacterium vaccinii]
MKDNRIPNSAGSFIRDDSDADKVIRHYLACNNQTVGGSGIEGMLLLLRDCLRQGTNFREKLRERLFSECYDALGDAAKLSTDLYTAFTYVVNKVERNELEADYDPVFYYMIEFTGNWFHNNENLKSVRESKSRSLFSSYFGNIRNSIVIYRILEEPDDPSTKNGVKKTEVIVTSILRNYYNIPFYIAYHQEAWGEAATLASAVYDYVFDASARGRPSNLLPKSGELTINWRRNADWIFDPANRHWLTSGVENTDHIEPRFLSSGYMM